MERAQTERRNILNCGFVAAFQSLGSFGDEGVGVDKKAPLLFRIQLGAASSMHAA